MKYGICICGLNGSGKTTLAGALAKELGFWHMDIERYYFDPSDNPYASPRTKDEVNRLLLEDIKRHPRFVFSAVSGDMPEAIVSLYKLVVYLDVPQPIRMERIRQRAVERFGDRVLPGGDLHEQEEHFFAFARNRTPEKIEEWLKTVTCRVARLDGTEPVKANVERIRRLLVSQ